MKGEDQNYGQEIEGSATLIYVISMHFHITLRELPDIIQPYDVILTDLIGQLIENVSANRSY